MRVLLMLAVSLFGAVAHAQGYSCGSQGCRSQGCSSTPQWRASVNTLSGVQTWGGGHMTTSKSAAPIVPFRQAFSQAPTQPQAQYQTLSSPPPPVSLQSVQPPQTCGALVGQWASLDDMEPFDTITYGSGRVGIVHRTKVCRHPDGPEKCPVHSAPVQLTPSTVLPGSGADDALSDKLDALTQKVEALVDAGKTPPLPDGTEAITISPPDGPSTGDLDVKIDALISRVEALEGGGSVTVKVQQLASVQQTIQTQINALSKQFFNLKDFGQESPALTNLLANMTDLEVKVERLQEAVENKQPVEQVLSEGDKQEIVSAVLQYLSENQFEVDKVADVAIGKLPPIRIEQHDDAGKRLPDKEVRLGEYLPPIKVVKVPMKRGENGQWEQAGEPAVDKVHLGEGFKMRLHPLD